MDAAVDGQAAQAMPKIGTPLVTRPSSSLSVKKPLANSGLTNSEWAVYGSMKASSSRPSSTRNPVRPVSYGTQDLPTIGTTGGAVRFYGLGQVNLESWDGVSVPPPWGADRANVDRLPDELIQQRHQKYSNMLDEQVLEKSRLRRTRCEQELEIDRNTTTSLDTANKSREKDCEIARQERAIYKELLATVDYRRRAAREKKLSEQHVDRICLSQAEHQVAWLWHVRKEEKKQEKVRLAQEWSSAAQHRQQAKELEKALALREEMAIVQEINRGTLPRRRLRRARQRCIATNRTPTKAHVAWAARS